MNVLYMLNSNNVTSGWFRLWFSLLGNLWCFNPFHVTCLFLYPLKKSENLWFSDSFLFSGGIER